MGTLWGSAKIGSGWKTVVFHPADPVFDGGWARMYQLTWSSKGGRNGRIRPDAPAARPPEPRVSAAAALVWEEHCVECAVPDCYTVCPLYVRRADGKCARFADGIAANPNFQGLYGYGAEVRFRRWGKLEAFWPGQAALYPAARLCRLARRPDRLERLEAAARRLPLPGAGGLRLGEYLRKVRKRMIRRRFRGMPGDGVTPDALVVRFYVPGDAGFRLLLEIDREGPVPKQNPIVFRRGFEAAPGWNDYRIPASDLPAAPGKIRIWPDADAEPEMVFTWLDLVAYEPGDRAGQPAAKVKCAAWDLDGTLWDGVIGEDGPDGVTPRPEALELVRELDARGVLQTIASKNDHWRAWPKIESLGLADMFLYPAIHWGPKSASLREIAKELDIGLDSFAFIDDAPFERAEVAAALPQVRVFDAAGLEGLLDRPEFDLPVTGTARLRRQSYLAEARRRTVAAGMDGGIDAFLESCHMMLRIMPPSPEQADRCLELLQRSNQFNLSGRRYGREAFDALLADPATECLAFEVSDDFGDYGLVGFAAVAYAEEGPALIDFVMSCRVARKRVEETFLAWYAARARRRGAGRFRVRMRATGRNGPLRDALLSAPLPRLGLGADGEEEVFLFGLADDIAVPGIIGIEEHGFDRGPLAVAGGD